MDIISINWRECNDVIISLSNCFYRAMLRYSAVYAIALCLSVCLPVRPSQVAVL